MGKNRIRAPRKCAQPLQPVRFAAENISSLTLELIIRGAVCPEADGARPVISMAPITTGDGYRR